MLPKPESGLPVPDADSIAHCERVAAHLQSLIDASPDGIPFSQFMHEALYAPGLGYYNAGARKFGAAGDFTTAPEASPLFGAVLARQLAPLIDRAGGRLMEIGAGSGTLAVQLLRKLAQFEALPQQYLILEISPDLIERQQSRLARELPEIGRIVRWIDAPPPAFRGVMVANEVADAIPVERFQIDADRVMRANVTGTGGEFEWHYVPAPRVLEDAVRRIERDLGRPLPDGYRSEVGPGRDDWMGALAASLEHGVILLVDYGMSRHEYYAPDRDDGWLQCHFRQHVHGDPLKLPGIQDITAWVDFTALAAVAADAGLSVSGYAPQGQFLLHGGLEREFVDFASMPEMRQAALSGEAKLLTMPGEMGENFKFLALTRGDLDPMAAFREIDRAHAL